jgi:hypothetical protein
MNSGWFKRPIRVLALGAAVVFLGGMGVVAAFAQVSNMTGQVMDFDKSAGTLEVELQRGDFATLYLEKNSHWIFQKVDVGDRVHALVSKENNRLVVKEITLQIGPGVQIDSVQGTVSKVNRRAHSIEVKTSADKEEVLYLDLDSLAVLGKVAVGDRIEARVETLIEAGGPKKVIRVIVVGSGP